MRCFRSTPAILIAAAHEQGLSLFSYFSAVATDVKALNKGIDETWPLSSQTAAIRHN
jgi:hypothetical protein